MGQPVSDRTEARVKATHTYLAMFATAIDMFEIDCGRYPTHKEGLAALVKDPGVEGWMGPYIRTDKPLTDPWGTALRYTAQAKGYKMVSAGPDKKFESEDDIHLK
jgi:general secretion pathway protein G